MDALDAVVIDSGSHSIKVGLLLLQENLLFISISLAMLVTMTLLF